MAQGSSFLGSWGSKPMDLGAAKQRAGQRQQPTPGYMPAQAGGFSGGRGGFTHQPAQPEYFNLPQFGAAQGFQPTTPTGQAMPSSSYQAWQDFIQKTYGMAPQDFLGASPEERYGGWAGEKDMAKTYEDYTKGMEDGVPQQPPGSPQEAAWAQFAGGLEQRRQQQELLNNAISSLQYGFGAARQGGPGSLMAMQSPLLQQMSQTYAGTQVDAPDYSYWLTPQTPTPASREPMQASFTRYPETVGQPAGQGQQRQPFRGLQSWQFG